MGKAGKAPLGAGMVRAGGGGAGGYCWRPGSPVGRVVPGLRYLVNPGVGVRVRARRKGWTRRSLLGFMTWTGTFGGCSVPWGGVSMVGAVPASVWVPWDRQPGFLCELLRAPDGHDAKSSIEVSTPP